MILTKVNLDKNQLKSLREPDKTFFISIAHMANEVNIITKLMFWISNTSPDNHAEQSGQFAYLLFFLRLLAGKLNEGWLLLDRKFFGAGLLKIYEPMLDTECSDSLTHLKRYFGNVTAVNIIRNHFGFHYSPEKLSEALPDTTQDLLLFMDGETAPNSLFLFSETILSEAILSTLAASDINTSYPELVEEFFDVALWFAVVSDGIMDAIIENHGSELRAVPPDSIELTGLSKFRELSIPWFAEAFDESKE